MLWSLLTWLLSLNLGGLPIFASDRFDLYRLGTNDTPLTFTVSGEAYPGVRLIRGFSPTGFIVVYRSEDMPFPAFDVGFQWTAGLDFETDTTTDAGGSQRVFFGGRGHPLSDDLLNAEFGPFGFLASAGGSPEWFQAEWIEPSFLRHLHHAVAGFTFALILDFIVTPSLFGVQVLRRAVWQM